MLTTPSNSHDFNPDAETVSVGKIADGIRFDHDNLGKGDTMRP